MIARTLRPALGGLFLFLACDTPGDASKTSQGAAVATAGGGSSSQAPAPSGGAASVATAAPDGTTIPSGGTGGAPDPKDFDASGGEAGFTQAGGGVPMQDNGGASGGMPMHGSGGASGMQGSGGAGGGMLMQGATASNADCVAIATDPNVNWREGALQADQAIVECLFSTLGAPIGYGENARGGYDPGGNSKLVVIKKNAEQSVEQQIEQAIAGTQHAWIVFDKKDFKEPYEIAMYRTHCDDPAVLSQLQSTAAECRDYPSWCARNGVAGERCLDAFFNQALNHKELPIRNTVVGSNKTIDGRGTHAFLRFSGFAVGRDSDGEPTETAKSVIITHLDFRGAGHVEDHQLDPDMLRLTGASEDIWVNKNTFNFTGDSAFDVKVGAHHITVSFNRVVNVIRSTLHGSKDERVINAQIRTTMHHNAFVTTEDNYSTLGNTGRRVPLIRRGTSHVWSNVFVNYRKEVLSVRVGASVLWENNAFVINAALQEKSSVEASLAEVSGNLLKDVSGGNFRTNGSHLWFSDKKCRIDDSTKTELTQASGNVADLSLDYTQASKAAIKTAPSQAGQVLIDYVTATAGHDGATPFSSPLAQGVSETIQAHPRPCQ